MTSCCVWKAANTVCYQIKDIIIQPRVLQIKAGQTEGGLQMDGRTSKKKTVCLPMM